MALILSIRVMRLQVQQLTTRLSKNVSRRLMGEQECVCNLLLLPRRFVQLFISILLEVSRTRQKLKIIEFLIFDRSSSNYDYMTVLNMYQSYIYHCINYLSHRLIISIIVILLSDSQSPSRWCCTKRGTGSRGA